MEGDLIYFIFLFKKYLAGGIESVFYQVLKYLYLLAVLLILEVFRTGSVELNL